MDSSSVSVLQAATAAQVGPHQVLKRRWDMQKAPCSCGSAAPVLLLLLVFMFMCVGGRPRVRSWGGWVWKFMAISHSKRTAHGCCRYCW